MNVQFIECYATCDLWRNFEHAPPRAKQIETEPFNLESPIDSVGQVMFSF